eukprot:gene9445-11988_t
MTPSDFVIACRVVRRVGIGDGCALFDYGLGIGKELGAHCLPDCKEARGACHLFEIFNPHGVSPVYPIFHGCLLVSTVNLPLFGPVAHRSLSRRIRVS